MFLLPKSAWIFASAVLALLVLEQVKVTTGWMLQRQHHNHPSSVCKRSETASTLLFVATAADEQPVTATKTLEVCVSPGCVADGAETALLKLQALASSDVAITRGVCCSLCGNGPITRDPESGKKHRKITTNQKILQLLELEDNRDPNQEAVLEGIDLCLKGDQDLQRRNYKGASQNYAKGMERGMSAAIVLGGDTNPVALEWVIKALCNEGTCKLKLNDIEGAILSAGTAYQLSQQKSSESLEVLQEAYQSTKQSQEELQALCSLFRLYKEQEEAQKGLRPARRKRISPMEANQRRSLEFRLQQLEATVKT